LAIRVRLHDSGRLAIGSGNDLRSLNFAAKNRQ